MRRPLIVTILPSPTRQQALVSNLLQSCLQHFPITLRLSRENFKLIFSIKHTHTHTNKPLNCSYTWTDVFEKHGKTFSHDAVFNGFLGDQSLENERNEWQGEKQ
jgi:hypothetical protein